MVERTSHAYAKTREETQYFEQMTQDNNKIHSQSRWPALVIMSKNKSGIPPRHAGHTTSLKFMLIIYKVRSSV